MRSTPTSLAVSLAAVALALGCEEPKKEAPAAPTAAAAPAASEPEPVEEAPKKIRPARDAKLDTKLTDERRKKLEAAVPDAKGFLVAADLEQEIHGKKLDDEAKALKAFDAKAKGKWILFTGNLNNMTPTGFEIAFSYTPKAEGDPFGMSRKWFYVKVADVKGFDANVFQKGEVGVVLAKYNGNKEAAPGHEVLELGHW